MVNHLITQKTVYCSGVTSMRFLINL